MKHLTTTFGIALTLCITAAETSAAVNINWVLIGDVGNATDPLTGGLYGSVAKEYRISAYEVTNEQYTEFLNTVDSTGANPNGIYNSFMGSNGRGGISFDNLAANGSKYSVRTNMGNKPVNFVSWYDAARFSNWVHNGQRSGGTETGAYTLNGSTGMPTKNSKAKVWIPSLDEWYKAAYYDPTSGSGGGDNYWRYATQSNIGPTGATANATGDVSNPGSNVANYGRFAQWNVTNLDTSPTLGNLTTIGSAGATSYYGTYDQSGNIQEWTSTSALASPTELELRGGSFNLGISLIDSGEPSFIFAPDSEGSAVGFRVAGIPEPSTWLLTLLFGSGLLILRKR